MRATNTVPSPAPARTFAPSPAAPSLRAVDTRAASCATCNLNKLCLAHGPRGDEIDPSDPTYIRKRIHRGDPLYRAGDAFRSLYVARFGFFKSFLMMTDGRSQITDFAMSAEIIGMDGIATGTHTVSVVALEDAEVCVIPYAQLDQLAGRAPGLPHQIHRAMSREIVRAHGLMLMLGSMRAEERVAAFLLNLSQRFAARGYSATEFNLRMTREEIGSYLGLKLETVSRVVSKLQERNLIAVHTKCIQIQDAAGLRIAMSQEEPRSVGD